MKELSLRCRANLADRRQIQVSASQHRALLTAIAADDAEGPKTRAASLRALVLESKDQVKHQGSPALPASAAKLAMLEVNGRRYRSARLGPESCVSPQSADGRDAKLFI